MQRFLVTLTSHVDGPADELFVDVRERCVLRAIKKASAECAELGPFAIMRAVPWPRRFSCVNDAARKMASGAR